MPRQPQSELQASQQSKLHSNRVDERDVREQEASQLKNSQAKSGNGSEKDPKGRYNKVDEPAKHAKGKQDVFATENLGDLNNRNVFTGLVKKTGITQESIVDLLWLNMDLLAVLSQDEDNNFYIETFKMADEEIVPITEKIQIADLKDFEEVQVTHDPKRQLFTIFRFSSMPNSEDKQTHKIHALIVDFRNFNAATRTADDIQMREVNTEIMTDVIGNKKIKQLMLLYNNVQEHFYELELLILAICQNPATAEETYHFFGAATDGEIEVYSKNLLNPLSARKAPLVGFMRLAPAKNLVVFEDGEVVLVESQHNHGTKGSWNLEVPFDRANTSIFDYENSTLCIQNAERSRSIFVFERNRWTHLADHMNTKWTFITMMGKFVIARALDKYTYVLELTETYDIQNSVRIGEDETWNFASDSSGTYSQFIILYQRQGKNFVWQKYDFQNQFHLSKLNALEQVCNGTLIKVVKESAAIEVKTQLKLFEDRFYEFQHIRFEGLKNIFVSSFTPYMIPGEGKRFLLLIKPEATLLNRKVLPQYFVYVNCDSAFACELKLEEKYVFHQIYFYSENCFLGQRTISPTVQEIATYQVEFKDSLNMKLAGTLLSLRKSLKLKSTEPDAEGQIIKANPFFNAMMKGITCVDLDYQNKVLYLIRQQITKESECEVFKLDLKKHLNAIKNGDNIGAPQQIEDLAEVIAKIQLFTEPISVFTRDDEITVTACFHRETQTIYALATTAVFSLLYRVDLNQSVAVNRKGIKFEQIITLPQAMRLEVVSSRQLVAASKTSICVFSQDPDECNDIKYLFETEHEEKQCKRHVGMNIDLKVDFDSNIMALSCDEQIVAVIFGSQSLLLEFDESQYPKFLMDVETNQTIAYKKSISNLNDLVYVFKQIMHINYNNHGYIKITEDQGNWDSKETYCPVTVCVSDFVTLFQDEDGNQGSDESQMIRHLYQNNYNIWESIFRDAMATEKLQITYDQINRFLSPVITDHGNNLLFHFCYNKPEKLEEIINLPGFEEYYKSDKKMFPIFYNFFGVSQIKIALAAHDNKSFYKLMFVLINMQDTFESSFLINSWMITAFEQGLDIFPLLESQILQTVCTSSILEHFDKWPQFHRDTEKYTVNYNESFMSLMHDEEAYKKLFGCKYEEMENEDKDLLSQNLYEMTPNEERNSLFPIKYFAERLPTPARDADEQLEYVFQLFEILSETEQMSYFRSGFVQRLIEYHWNGPLVKYYSVVSGFYLFSFFLIVTCIFLLQYQSDEPWRMTGARCVISCINLIVLCLSLCTFEIKSFLSDKFGYVKSFWNQNDILLFFMSLTVCVLEFYIFFNHRDDFKYDYGFACVEGEECEDIKARLLKWGAERLLRPKPKNSRGDLVFNVAQYYSYPRYEQYLRMCYGILSINVFLKILNVAQFSENVAFLVKMLGFIFEKFQPFILFWFGIIWMFALCVNALDVVFYNADSMTQGGEYNGFGGMFGPCLLFTIRNSVGDFQPDTIKFLPVLQRVTMWIYWILITVISVIILMNFTIALINDSYQESIPTRIEEAYQKKCGILCDLNDVFGQMAFVKRSETSILVTRQSQNSDGAEEENESLNLLKKQLLIDQIELNDLIHETQKDLIAQNDMTLEMVKTIKYLLKNDEDNQPNQQRHAIDPSHANLAAEVMNKLGQESKGSSQQPLASIIARKGQ